MEQSVAVVLRNGGRESTAVCMAAAAISRLQACSQPLRANQFRNHTSMINIGQTFIAAVVIEGQSFVIKPQLVQNRCVQIGCLSAVGDGSIAEIIGGPVSLTAANSTTGKPDAEAVRMMITSLNAGDLVAIALFSARRATKLTAPQDKCGIKQATLFKVGQQAGNREIGLSATAASSGHVVRVSVPWLPGHEDLNKTNTSLHEATSHQTTLTIRTCRILIQAIEFLNLRGLLVEIERICGRKLHACGEFKAGDAGIQFQFAWSSLLVSCVKFPQEFHSPVINPGGSRQLRLKVQHRHSF